MSEKQTRLSNILFLAAFIIAFLMRFLDLGLAPLSDFEARWALQAVSAAHPVGLRSQIIIDEQPAYVLLTSLLFAAFGTKDFMARVLPALAGVLLVLAPYFLRHRLGIWAAVIAAFGLALDAGLVTVSRQAGGPMMAVSFSLLALALWIEQKPLSAGILAGLALLSGPAIFPGLIGLGSALLVFRSLHKLRVGEARPLEPEMDFESRNMPHLALSKHTILVGLAALGVAILLAGTLFLRYPQGLAAWAQSLATYLTGWTSASETSVLKMLITLVVYQPVALIFTLIGVGRFLLELKTGKSRQKMIWLISLLWLFTMLVLIISYPARQTSDLVWIIVLFWVAASFELEQVLPQEIPNQVSIFQAILIFILGSLFWISLVSANTLIGFGENPMISIQVVLLLGILLLGALSSALVALGWSLEISRYGATWGVVMLGLIYLISTAWGSAHLRFNQPEEMWSFLPGTGQSTLMLNTLTDFSDRNSDLINSIEILSTVNNPSMRWALREFPKARFSDIIPEGYMPAILITSAEEEPSGLAQAYRGQDFLWWTWPGWENTIPPDKVSWFAFREAPVTGEKVIVWVRGDQFPGQQIGSQSESTKKP